MNLTAKKCIFYVFLDSEYDFFFAHNIKITIYYIYKQMNLSKID